MAANTNARSPRSTRPSVSLSHARMPHVFVIPPEEEQQDNPPWCCFDADEQPENNGDFPSNPNIHFLDVPYLFQPSENGIPHSIPHRTSVYHPRPSAPLSRRLEKKQRPEAVKIISSKPSQERQREDSDVIEVVKVKRTRDAFTDLEENANVKRSKTLKARATKALQSIKNVGKSSRRTHVKELWTSTESMPGIFKGMQEQLRPQQDLTNPKKASLSRASSRSLSQLFQPTKSSPSESTFALRVDKSVARAEVHDASAAPHLSHLKYNDTNLSLAEIPSTVISEDRLNRPVTPSLSTKKSTIKKFSVRELHRLFSFSSSSPDQPVPLPTATTEPSPSDLGIHLPSNSTCTLSSLYPDVPMEEDIHPDTHFLDIESADRQFASRYHRLRHNHPQDDFPPHRLSNFSFEMRLDSLHFDALSFDPEDIDVSMEGNVLR